MDAMDEKELFKDVLKWAYYYCKPLYDDYFSTIIPGYRQHVARKILIEKVKKEPDFELLVPPGLKEWIRISENVDLTGINTEYQKEKGIL
jgi:hypothetical protein